MKRTEDYLDVVTKRINEHYSLRLNKPLSRGQVKLIILTSLNKIMDIMMSNDQVYINGIISFNPELNRGLMRHKPTSLYESHNKDMFKDYLSEVKELIKSDKHKLPKHTLKEVNDNIDHFKVCYSKNIAPYKAILYLNDYINI